MRRCSVITHVQYPGGARFCSSPSTMTFLSQAGDFASQPFDWFAFCHETVLLTPAPKPLKPSQMLQKSCQRLAARTGGENGRKT